VTYAVTLRESDAETRTTNLDRRTELAEREAKEAASIKGRYLAALADLRAMIAKHA